MTDRQLLLDLPAREGLARGDFLPAASNRAALAALDGWRGWPGATFLLTGPEGAGRTHLAHIWAAEAGATPLDPAALAEALPQALAGTAPLALDDAHLAAGDAAAEEALFHLLNHAGASRRPFLLTARGAPAGWGVALPDLLSRLQALPAAALDRPDDDLLWMVLAKLCDDRQLVVPPQVLSYVVPRIHRSLSTAARLTAELDALAVSRQRPVTRALAAEALTALDSAAAACDPGSPAQPHGQR